MSGIEVVAAVSAVVSAFHAGSELLKHVKSKRRKARQAQQDFEEKQLQDSLVSGEQQIGSRYAQDMRQFGDAVRVGDVIARDRLLHITIMMQSEVIKSLQMAARYDNAIINLTILHEASITNRRDTLVALDELKQRLFIRTPISRRLLRSPVARVQTARTSTFDPSTLIPDNYVPTAVTLPQHRDAKDTKSGLSNYFRMKRHSSDTSAPDPNRASVATDINYSEALYQLVNARGAGVMKDIDEIIDAYQGLHMSHRASEPWGDDQHFGQHETRRDTLSALNMYEIPDTDPLSPTREELQKPKSMPPSPREYRLDGPTNDSHLFDSPHGNHDQHFTAVANNPYRQKQTHELASRCSASSSIYSEAPSLVRDSSTSSRDSHGQPPPPPPKHSLRDVPSSRWSEALPQAPYPYHDERQDGQPSSIAQRTPYPSARPPDASQPQHQSEATSLRRPQNTLTCAPREETVPLMHSSHAAPYQQLSSHTIAPLIQPMQHATPGNGQGTQRQSETSQTTKIPLVPSAASTHSNTSGHTITQPAIKGPRQASIAHSVASTDSSGSGALGVLPGPRVIRSGTIQSGVPGSKNMLEGRPCKANGFWGFCKGSWTIREDVKKGLQLSTIPQGMYATKAMWVCASCPFSGTTFSAPHPTKKHKQISVIDPRVSVSGSGIRYRWIFLAKSHVKKRAIDSHTDYSNYGCIICSVEGVVSSIYGDVETLMNHIALAHVAGMSDKTRQQVKCVLGRVAADSEDFDLNVPIFSPVQD